MGEINALPAHVLLVHAVVVGVPLTALALVLAAVFPRARALLGVAPLVLAVGTLALVPVTTSAGEWLEERLPATSLLRKHTAMGEDLLPWVIGLVVLAAALWWLDGANGLHKQRSVGPIRLEDRRTALTLGALSVVVALAAVVTTYRIGDSGARAAWEGRLDAQATQGDGD